MNQSISAAFSAAKIQLTSTLNKIISESEIPSQLYESVLLEMLLEIKQQKISELAVENMQLHNRIDEANKQIEDYKQQVEKQEIRKESK